MCVGVLAVGVPRVAFAEDELLPDDGGVSQTEAVEEGALPEAEGAELDGEGVVPDEPPAVEAEPRIAPGVDESGSYIAARRVSTFYTDVDYAHYSSGDVSSHGWWVKLSGSATHGTVTVILQRPAAGGEWRTKATNSRTIRPGGGSSRRVVVRYTCGNRQGPYTWRSMAEVNIVGEIDPVQWATRGERAVACSPR